MATTRTATGPSAGPRILYTSKDAGQALALPPALVGAVLVAFAVTPSGQRLYHPNDIEMLRRLREERGAR